MACIGGRSGRRWRRRCRRRSVRRRAGRRRSSARIGRSIDAWLEADREAPRKQRHTAKRIWRRLVDEHGADVAETTVRDYVRARKRAMGWPVGEVFIPQVHAPGVEAEVDWGEAQVDWPGSPTKVHLFFMRASFSGAAFCQASLVETQQAFLELHVEAFEWFGGVFEQIRFDNLTLGGQAGPARAAGASRPTASSRCARTTCSSRSSRRRALQGAHEKGGVEGEVGRFRRNHLVPVPAVADLARAQRAAARRLRGGPAPADRRARRDGRRGVGERAAAAARAARASRSTRPRPRRRASTPSRWSRSARTATRSRSRWPA